MTQPFDYFVIFAEMRTGSNLLEATLSQVPGITCHSEAFNPKQMGGPKATTILGVTLAERQRDPMPLLDRIRDAEGLNGFRFFFDHDPRILDRILGDRRCAKIVLTRNPVASFVSLRIANQTKRWRMTDVRHRVACKPVFKPAEFEAFLNDRQQFQIRIQNALQTSGQTAFYMDYEDSLRPEVINGLLKHLGFETTIDGIANTLVRQNPEEMAEKVRNFPEMEAALQRIDWANLARTPNFEPRRGPGVPRIVAAAGAPVFYLPIQPHGDAPIREWLSRLGTGGLVEDFTQKTLRGWMRKAPGHRSFTVIRHPLARANDIFAEILVRDGRADLRQALRAQYNVPLPPDGDLATMSAADYRAALLAFLGFLKVNLNGQTPHRQDMLWASQWAMVQGFAQFAMPDMLCREDRLAEDLTYLAHSAGVDPGAPPEPPESAAPVPLTSIHDGDLDAAARDAYQRDYVTFGFTEWKRPG